MMSFPVEEAQMMALGLGGGRGFEKELGFRGEWTNGWCLENLGMRRH